MTEPLRSPEWPFRSLLFVPGHKPDWIAKAPRYAPDAVILDLEDAVPPDHKAGARLTTRDGVGSLASVGVGAFVRVNPFASGGLEDVRAVTVPGLTAVLLPKARSVDDVRTLHDALSYAEGAAGMPHGTIAIVPIPETAEGLHGARDLAAASPRVKGIMTGFTGAAGGDTIFAGDIALAAGFRPTPEGLEQVYLASKIALDSRAAGAMFPLAGIIGTALNDLEAIRRLVTRARSFGFTGVALIHPSHVAIANEIYTPTAGQVAFAQGLIDAMAKAEASGLGAVTYRGIMIDYAVLAIARETLAEASRRGVLDANAAA